jgi:serine/threonine protein kinase
MVMDLLGPSLEDLFQRCEKKFTLRTVVAIGLQIFTRLEYMHSKKFIHRDIKPENFLIGTHQYCSKVFVIDFGLSKKYIQKTGEHIPYKDNKSLTGTPRYASINSHLGIEQGRRDDLESVTYMLIYFLKGSLPWQNLKADPNYDRYEKILEKKLSVSIENLTNGLPPQFAQLVAYTRGLHFIEEPDYEKIRGLLA